MEDLKTSATNLKQHVGEYVKTYMELTKAKATLGASKAAAGAAIGFTAFLLALFFLLFLFMGLAFWIGSLVESTAAGFLIIAGFFFLVIALIFMLRKKVIVPWIQNTIISKAYEQKDSQ